MDNTVIHTIAQCISRGKKCGELVDMLHHVLDHHRYIAIMGDLKPSPELKYHTDIIATDPIPHQTICHLEKNKFYLRKSPFHVACLQQMLIFLHSSWQNMQRIKTMSPPQRVKLCWFTHQRIRMVC